jgi:hypothetical protein
VLLVAVSGAAVSTAQAQKNHVDRPAPPGRHLSVLEGGRRVEPIRVAGVQEVAPGKFAMTTPWIDYEPRHTDVPGTILFDCYEGDPTTGAPTNFCTSGCGQLGNCPAAGAGSRWYFGLTYVNPFIVNDIATVATGFNGAHANRAQFAWNWGAAAARPMFVLITTYETFHDCAAGLPTTEMPYQGVVYQYQPQAGGGGYFYSDIDLTTNPAMPFHQIPMDGSGAYSIRLGTAYDPTTQTFTYDFTPGTQCMLWGTGNAETPPDGRVGTQLQFQWDDDTPADGMHTLNECADYTLTGDICPNPLGAMLALWTDQTGPAACFPDCNLDHQLNVNDFVCFQAGFAAQNLAVADCDHNNALNVLDFVCFQSAFAAGCSSL